MNIIYQGTLYLDGGASTNWFIHGYSQSEIVTFAIVVNYGAIGSAGPLNFAQGEYYEHVDGTRAQKIYFTNHDQFKRCSVDVYQILGLRP